MKNLPLAHWLFHSLGILFFLFCRDFESTTLICVFYSLFVGTVWSLVPQMAGNEPLNWKHLLPPFLLIMLMMFSAKLKLVMSTDVVMITSMSLIHFRASILSFARLKKGAQLFSWVQLFSFFFALGYVFQRNIFPSTVTIPRNGFLIGIASLSAASLAFLFYSKRKVNEPSGSQTSSS